MGWFRRRPWLPVRALNTVSLATLPPESRTEGTGLFNLSRNIGSSVGISVVTSLLTQNTQANHADIVQHVTAVNRVFENPAIAQFWNPDRRRTRRARCHDHAASADHRVHHDSAADDCHARRRPAACCFQEGARRQ